jgi:hypothetical protein
MNKKPAAVFFHLGLTKVASTYFQKLVFPSLEGVRFFPKHQFGRYRELAETPAEGKFLFSTEKDRRIVEAVEEIVSVWPDAKIILFVRRHDDWPLSRYKYRIRKLGGEHFTEFFDLDGDTGLWKRDTLLLRPKIEAIERLCKTPPLVLSYDLLREDPEAFLTRLTSFMGTRIMANVRRSRPVNRAFSEKQLIVLRRWNRFHSYRAGKNEHSVSGKIRRRYFEYLLHMVAFVARFIPMVLIREKRFLTAADEQELQRIRAYYADDWAFSSEYDRSSQQ